MSRSETATEKDAQLEKDIAMLDKLLGVEAREPGIAASLPAAIRIIEALEPAGGRQVPVFPASYAGATDQSPPVYDLSGVEYGEVEEPVRVKKSSTKVRQIIRAKLCAIDSPQSQANRMEPAFLECDDLQKLVPQTKATIPRRAEVEGSASVLLLPHRVADFRIRFSNRADDVRKAVTAFARGDALPLLKIFPTSVLFGFWDSRDQGTKHARILLSRIDATNVIPCRRHALYSGPYSKDEFSDVVVAADPDKLSELGFSAAPSDGLGGIMVDKDNGKIERLSLLSLTDLARINCLAPTDDNSKQEPASPEGEEAATRSKTEAKERDMKLTNAARRYLFSLAALAEGHERSKGSHRLRSGCELIGIVEPTFEMLQSKVWKPATEPMPPSDEDQLKTEEVESLYFDRKRLIAIATNAMIDLEIKAEGHAEYVVSRESLGAGFGTAPAPAQTTSAKKPAAKKAAGLEANAGSQPAA